MHQRFFRPILLLFGSFFLLSAWQPVLAQAEYPGKFIADQPCIEKPDESYALYLPSAFDKSKRWPLLMVFDPLARGELGVKHFAAAAERFGIIVAGSNRTRNYVAFDTNWTSVKAMWEDLMRRLPLDPTRMYAGGFSGGARLASTIALKTGTLAGVILYGADFPVDVALLSDLDFACASAVGREDMNYVAMRDWQAKITDRAVPNVLFVFDGPHRWPPQEMAFNTLGWLTLRAMREGALALDRDFVEDWYMARLKDGQKLETTNRLSEAGRVYDQLAADLGDAIATPELQAAREKLARDPRFKKSIRTERKLMQNEEGQRAQFTQRFANGKNAFLNSGPPIKDLPWWRAQSRRLREAANAKAGQGDSGQDSGKPLSNLRLLGYLWGMTYEASVFAIQEKQFKEALYINQVAEAVFSQHSQPPYNLACVFAQLGDTDAALDALARAVSQGLGERRFIDEQPLLDPLRGLPRFAAITSQLGVNGP